MSKKCILLLQCNLYSNLRRSCDRLRTSVSSRKMSITITSILHPQLLPTMWCVLPHCVFHRRMCSFGTSLSFMGHNLLLILLQVVLQIGFFNGFLQDVQPRLLEYKTNLLVIALVLSIRKIGIVQIVTYRLLFLFSARRCFVETGLTDAPLYSITALPHMELVTL